MLISVIVPVYKVEKYLKRCVDSILNQTFTDFELILVDDGSPDRCGKMCDEYAKEDCRIHVIHKKNGGLSDARNSGIDWCFKNSNSKWIAFIDSDDWIHPRYLQSLYEAACIHNGSISVCECIKTDVFTSYKRIDKANIEIVETDNLFLEHNMISSVAWAKLYKRECFCNTRYPFGKLHEDEFVTYKLLFKNDKIAYVNDSLYFYFNNQNGIMNSNWSLKKLDLIEALKQQCEYFKNSKYNNVYQYIVKKYIATLKRQYDNLVVFENSDDKKKHLAMIKSELRKYLRIKGINLPIVKNKQLYSIAYPVFMKVYLFFLRVKRKFVG